jgi:hypothetical protein
MNRWTLALAMILTALSGCKGGGDAKPQATRAAAEERLNLLTNPSIYLEATELKYDPDPASPALWILASFKVWNKSQFAVRDLQGDVTWLDEAGRRLGSGPLTLKGSIPAGSATTFSIASGTMTRVTQAGAVFSATVAFTKVTIE